MRVVDVSASCVSGSGSRPPRFALCKTTHELFSGWTLAANICMNLQKKQPQVHGSLKGLFLDISERSVREGLSQQSLADFIIPLFCSRKLVKQQPRPPRRAGKPRGAGAAHVRKRAAGPAVPPAPCRLPPVLFHLRRSSRLASLRSRQGRLVGSCPRLERCGPRRGGSVGLGGGRG